MDQLLVKDKGVARELYVDQWGVDNELHACNHAEYIGEGTSDEQISGCACDDA